MARPVFLGPALPSGTLSMSRATARGIAFGNSRSVESLAQLGLMLRSDIWDRMMATAQRRALLWWRNRRVAPGLAARFTVSGAAYYGFGARRFNPYRTKPYYHVTGSLERLLLSRKPRTSRKSGTVETRLAYGGGRLNFLTTPNQRPVVGWTTRQTTTVTQVGTGTVTRVYSRRVPVRGGDTYAAAFGKFNRDRAAIEARVQVELRRIVRSSAFDKRTGRIKSSLMEAA